MCTASVQGSAPIITNTTDTETRSTLPSERSRRSAYSRRPSPWTALTSVRVRSSMFSRDSVSVVFVMIGAEPCTEAVHMVLGLDEAGYIRCGEGAAQCEGPNRWRPTDRGPHLLETVWPGIFAAGDVRAGATKRVAGAVGDGGLAVRFAHQVLDA